MHHLCTKSMFCLLDFGCSVGYLAVSTPFVKCQIGINSCIFKGILMISKWPKHLIVLIFVHSGIAKIKMAKVFITLIN